jgi:hypothetical protein
MYQTIVRALSRLARRGVASHPRLPKKRRLILLQIDGLSTGRLIAALDRGEMPRLRAWLKSGEALLKGLRCMSEPSTPVFTAGLLYGERGGVPGFGWYDRHLGRTVRMDLADDVQEIERSLLERNVPLLRGGVSYGTIWPGGAEDAFFNVMLFNYGVGGRAAPRNAYDRLLSVGAGISLFGRVSFRLVLELAVGLWDFGRWCLRVRSTRFEWRFLYMRLFVSVVLRDIGTQMAILDILRGVPCIYIDYLGYDEYAHRRGPDSELALYNLRGIDAAIERIRRTAASMPEYGYDVFVFSDHGQSATTPFERVVGCDLSNFVLHHAAPGRMRRPVEATVIKELAGLRSTELFSRTLWPPFRPFLRWYVSWLRRRLENRLGPDDRSSLAGIEVVTGGSVAHLYFAAQGDRLKVEEIEQRWPVLMEALRRSKAVGLMAGLSASGPVVYYRAQRYSLENRAVLEPLPPFRRIGYELLAHHLRHAALGSRSGDLVVYGAFAEAGSVAFDFEFGSHGGVGPDELEQFVIHPRKVHFPLLGDTLAESFYRFFQSHYGSSQVQGKHEEFSA